LSVPGLVDQLGGVELPNPITVAPELRTVLAQVSDPRKPRSVRHGLVVVLTTAMCAVAVGARSFVAIAEWVADLPTTVAEHLGTAARCPSEATIRRLVQDVDADRFDAAIGEFVQQRCAALAPPGRRRALAIDGKTVRGSRSTGPDGEQPARHLLAVIDQHTRVVLGQVSIDTRVEGKTSEISRFAPLLDTLTALDLTDVVITADALHTQREHVETLAARGAHWVLTVKGNQPRLRRQLAGLPWREVEPAHRSVETAHGRREHPEGRHDRCRDRVPLRRQAVQIVRRTRPVNARSGKAGRWHTETIYAITDLRPHQARPDELAGWIRGHWQIENALH
jgi:predicted transposase YbfD/YdcC